MHVFVSTSEEREWYMHGTQTASVRPNSTVLALYVPEGGESKLMTGSSSFSVLTKTEMSKDPYGYSSGMFPLYYHKADILEENIVLVSLI